MIQPTKVGRCIISNIGPTFLWVGKLVSMIRKCHNHNVDQPTAH